MLYTVVTNEEIFELGNDSDGSVMTNNQRSRLLLPSFAHPIYLYLVGLLLIFRLLPKLYIPSTLNIDLILWHRQLIACAVKC